MQRVKQIDASTLDLEEKIVSIRRVTKVVKGGRNPRFSVLVVVGDKNGHVGFGTGKSTEIPEAVKKAVAEAKKNLISVSLYKTTLPHEIIGVHKSGRVLLKPAGKGTGVIAGGAVRYVLEYAGIKDIRTKSLGSTNAINMVRATMNGLINQKTAEEVAKLRGKTVDEVLNGGGNINGKSENNSSEEHK